MTAEASPGPVLAIESLAISYRTPAGRISALRDLDLAISAGEVLGLAGESGSGKSTLANAIMRHLAPNAAVEGGRIRFAGSDLLGASEARLAALRGRSIGMVHQDPNAALNPVLRIGEQIAEIFVHHRKLDRRQAWREAVRWLARVAIADPEFSATKFPHQISGGERQRVLIAMAFSCRPGLLILDEPTTALDATTAVEILELLRELQRETGSAALFICHDLNVVRAIADRVAIIYSGTIVEEGEVGRVLQAPRHPYTRALLASLPSRSGKARRLFALPGGLPPLERLPLGCILQARCPFVADVCRELAPHLAGPPVHRDACLRAAETAAEALPSAAPAPAARDRPRALSPVLEVSGLRVVYGRRGAFDRLLRRKPPIVCAVDGVDLALAMGETLAVVGESGCGKSSLARALVGLAPASGGTIRLDGRELDWSSAALRRGYRRAVQIIFQQPGLSLNPRMTVGEIIERPLRLFRSRNAGMVSAGVIEMLDQVRLPRTYARRFPHELSGGEKQRVAIARALAARPRVVICDEITAGLDVSVQAAIVNLLTELQEAFGITYLFISHDLHLVRHMSDHIAIMYFGRIVEYRTSVGLLHPPYHPYTESLLSALTLTDSAATVRPIKVTGARPDPRSPPAGCSFHTRCPRRLGALCVDAPPPRRDVGPNHWLTCHIEPAQLSLASGIAGKVT